MSSPSASLRASKYAMISVEKAIEVVLQQAPVLTIISRNIDECNGLVIAEDIR